MNAGASSQESGELRLDARACAEDKQRIRFRARAAELPAAGLAPGSGIAFTPNPLQRKGKCYCFRFRTVATISWLLPAQMVIKRNEFVARSLNAT
ncbi:hypothetical protein ACWD1Y_45165 [Streptomyces sp. NPDC002814]